MGLLPVNLQKYSFKKSYGEKKATILTQAKQNTRPGWKEWEIF